MSDFLIKPDYGIEIVVYGRHLLASPSTDSIMRFTKAELDYLRYVDPEQQRISMEFLGSVILGELAGMGIPDSRQRNTILESEYNEWLQWQSLYGMDQFESELGNG